MSKNVVFYSHDGRSFGHISIMGKLAKRLLSEEPTLNIYGISSSRYPHLFLPSEMEYLKLPSYTSIDTPEGTLNKPILDIDQTTFRKLRSALISGFFSSFPVNYLVIDGHPLGKYQELEATLQCLPPETRTGWILRVAPDYPENVDATLTPLLPEIARHIDDILVVGDLKVFNLPAHCASIRPLEDKLRYLGFLCPDTSTTQPHQYKQETVFSQIGGGGGGLPLLQTITKAASIVNQQRGTVFDIVTGNYITDQEYELLTKSTMANENIRISRYTNEVIERMKGCNLFIGSGGYGTLCEVLSVGCKSIIIPRQHDRGEQELHARGLFATGHISAVVDLHSSTNNLANTILKELNNPVLMQAKHINSNGIKQFSRFIREKLSD